MTPPHTSLALIWIKSVSERHRSLPFIYVTPQPTVVSMLETHSTVGDSTSIPQKSKKLPKKSKNHTQKIQKLFASRMFWTVCSSSTTNVYCSKRSYPLDVPPEPPPKKIIYYRGRRIAGPIQVGLPKKSQNITEKIQKNYQKIQANYQKKSKQMTKTIQANDQKNPSK